MDRISKITELKQAEHEHLLLSHNDWSFPEGVLQQLDEISLELDRIYWLWKVDTTKYVDFTKPQQIAKHWIVLGLSRLVTEIAEKIISDGEGYNPDCLHSLKELMTCELTWIT